METIGYAAMQFVCVRCVYLMRRVVHPKCIPKCFQTWFHIITGSTNKQGGCPSHEIFAIVSHSNPMCSDCTAFSFMDHISDRYVQRITHTTKQSMAIPFCIVRFADIIPRFLGSAGGPSLQCALDVHCRHLSTEQCFCGAVELAGIGLCWQETSL